MTAPQPVAGPPPVIIARIDSMVGLGAARLLGSRGVRCIGVAFDPKHYGVRTRACERIVMASSENLGLIDAIQSVEERSVVIPCTDDAVLEVSRWRERLEPPHVVPLAPHETLHGLLDKEAFAEHAARHGLAVPRTLVMRSRPDALRAARELEFPCILKPGTKTSGWFRVMDRKAVMVRSGAEVLDLYDRAAPVVEVLLAQEWIPGEVSDLYSCYVYLDRHSQTLATFVFRKVRQWPEETGTASMSVECRNDEVRRQAVALFEGAGFSGLGHLEVKRNPQTGQHLMIEANVGRPVGPSFAEAGGVELLYTAYCDAAGLELPASREQRYIGARSIFLRQDVRVALLQIHRGELGLREWLRSMRGPKAFALLSATDPMPFVVDVLQTARRVLRKGPGRWSGH